MTEGNSQENVPQRSSDYQIFCVQQPASGPENEHECIRVKYVISMEHSPSSEDDGPLGRKKVKNLAAFYGTQRFITVFTTTMCLNLS
jgi:hypothetical protein